MDMISLQATARPASASPRKMRREGRVPCVVYGHDVKNAAVSCAEKELHRAFVKAGESTLVELDLDGKKIPVLFKDITFEPISSREVHADFYAVNMKEEIETQVPIRIEGESPAIKDLGGILVVPHEHVTVRCLPAALPHDLPLDISGLKEFRDTVTVAHLALPKDVKVMETPETVLATVQEPRKEEEITPAPAAESAMPAEGAAAAPAEGGAPTEGTAAVSAEGGAAKKEGKK